MGIKMRTAMCCNYVYGHMHGHITGVRKDCGIDMSTRRSSSIPARDLLRAAYRHVHRHLCTNVDENAYAHRLCIDIDIGMYGGMHMCTGMSPCLSAAAYRSGIYGSLWTRSVSAHSRSVLDTFRCISSADDWASLASRA